MEHPLYFKYFMVTYPCNLYYCISQDCMGQKQVLKWFIDIVVFQNHIGGMNLWRDLYMIYKLNHDKIFYFT